PRASAYWQDRTRRYSRRRCSPARVSRFFPHIGPEPGKSIGRLTARVIFAADKTRITEPVELREQEWIVQLFIVGLVARRHACNLDMFDDRHHLSQPHGHIAMQDLTVVD